MTGAQRKPYLLALDQGTTSSRALLLDRQLEVLAADQHPVPTAYPHDGWVEQDAEDLFAATLAAARGALQKAGVAAAEVAAAAIANQRETTLVWDLSSGETVAPAIVWQDRRTHEACERLRRNGVEDWLRERTGLVIDPYFSASKLQWILEHVPDARSRAERGELAFGTVDSYLIWRFTGGRVHATDATNASRTLLFDIRRQLWDRELCELFGVSETLLPEVLDCTGDFGFIDAEHLGAEIPIVGVAGDQQAALIGQACFEPGMTKATYGTGAFLVCNTGERLVRSRHRLLATVAYRFDGKVTYALEGSLFVAGAVVQWLRDGLGLIEHASEATALAAGAQPDHRVYLVPAFTGLGAPHWDAAARGALFGLTRDTGRAELAAAALSGVAYQTRDLLEAARADGSLPNTLRVDGGMVASDWFCQCLADTLSLEIQRPRVTESTSQGAAVLAALGAGWLDSPLEAAHHWTCERAFTPVLDAERRERRYAGWKDAVRRTLSTDEADS